MMQAPLPGTWWVKDNLLLAGGFPGGYEDGEAEIKLKALLEAGVRCFVSLQQQGEMDFYAHADPYPPIAKRIAEEMDVEVVCHNFPIVDMGIPNEKLMLEILDVVVESMEQKKCVYVHCWGGHGRTGTVVGCWLREQGMSGKETLQHIQKLRQHDSILLQWESPQTNAQRNMILKWK